MVYSPPGHCYLQAQAGTCTLSSSHHASKFTWRLTLFSGDVLPCLCHENKRKKLFLGGKTCIMGSDQFCCRAPALCWAPELHSVPAQLCCGARRIVIARFCSWLCRVWALFRDPALRHSLALLSTAKQHRSLKVCMVTSALV